MPAAYGFKTTDPKDALPISNVISQADSVTEQKYDTLAQYRINDVELKPETLSLGLPRKWMLTLNTTLMGFNRPNNQSLFFNEKQGPVGDGYATYALSSKEFANMLQGGLYDNPQDYTKRLKQNLINKEFYRKTTVNLTTAKLLDSRLTISAGDLREQHVRSREYMIGNDLNAYASFTPENQKDMQSNLSNVFNSQVNSIVQDPVKPRQHDTNTVLSHEPQVMPELPDVQIHSEVDMNINKEKYNAERQRQQQAQQEFNQGQQQQESEHTNDQPAPSSNVESSYEHQEPSAESDSPLNVNGQFDVPMSQSTSEYEDATPEVDNSVETDEGTTEPLNGDTTATPSVSDEPNSAVSDTSSFDSLANDSVESSVDSSSADSASGRFDIDDGSESTSQSSSQPDVNDNDADSNSMTLDDIVSQFGGDDNNSTQLRRRRRQHAYVDDFGAALQNSQVAKQTQLNKRRNLQRQQSEADHQGPDL